MSMRSLLPSVWGHPLARRADKDDPFSFLHSEVEKVIDDFSRAFPSPGFAAMRSNGGSFLTPRIDVSESEKEIQITVELPGVDEKDVDVRLADDVLRIKGEKKAEKEEKNKNYRLVERSYGMFERTIPLPFSIDPDAVAAKFAKGVLSVTLPKPAEVEAKSAKIEIKGED